MARTLTDEEFTEFVHAVWPGLYRTAYLMLGDHQLAEDLVQSSLAKTYASWRRVKEPAAAPAYARTVLANTAASWFRRRGWRNERPTEDLPDVVVDHDPTTRTVVVDALATLAPRQRAVVVLRYYDDLSVREVAQALGISEGTVKSQTADALSRMRAALVDEAEAIRVPPAEAHDVVVRGRRIRRDRQVRVATAVTAVVAVVGVLLATVASLGRDRADPVPPADTRNDHGWAVASGSGVQLGTGQVIELDDGPVGYAFYTSVGVLANFGTAGAPWASTSKWALVRADGTATYFRLETGTQLVGTDPDSPYVTYIEATDSPKRWDLVVRDLRTGRVADKVTLHGSAAWAGDETPDSFLMGDHVYVSLDDTAVDVDLAAHKVSPNDVLPAAGVFAADGGRAILTQGSSDKHASVVDIETGETLMDYTQGDRYLRLSPDGHYVLAAPRRVCSGGQDTDCPFDLPTAYVYDLDTGHRAELDVKNSMLAWTRGGRILRVTTKQVSVCDPASGACASTPLEIGPDQPVTVDTMNW